MADLPNLISTTDLSPFATIETSKARALIEDAVAQAVVIAPCLASDDLDKVTQGAARAVLRAAILRWNEIGTGARVTHQETRGPFSHSETYDATGARRGVFWPSEIRALQTICKRGNPYVVDMLGDYAGQHAPTCARAFGANYCDCGAELGITG